MVASSNPYWIAPDVKFDALTIGLRHHFFASNNCPWDEKGRDVLAMEASFADRLPTEKDALSLGLIPSGTKRFEAFDKSYSWNWQQGAMLQWLPQGSSSERKVIYNQRANNRLISVIRDLESGSARTLPMPIHTVSSNGAYAISLHKEGIYRLDLTSGTWKLILSLQDAADLQNMASRNGVMHCFHDVQINPAGSRVSVLHSWHTPTSNMQSGYQRLITVNPDGSEPFVLIEATFSHYSWLNETQLTAWVEDVENGQRCYLLDDQSQNRVVLGAGILDGSKHTTLSPDKKWLLAETNLDNNFHTMLLWQWPDGPRLEVARFYSPPELNGPLRCDLHPRWARDGRKVCIDSAHTGSRQIYVLDVSQITQG